MSNAKGTVRIGPVSLLSLTIIVCLAVMAVLAAATAQATYAAADKQTRFVDDTYANERAAQDLVSEIDAALAPIRAAEGNQAEALAAVESALAARNEASLNGDQVDALFVADSGRTLDVAIDINDDATYTIARWSATTQWNDTDPDDVLWSGSTQPG